MSTLKEALIHEIEIKRGIGHPALVERFVLEKGRPYVPFPEELVVGTPKECFKNSYETASDLLLHGMDEVRYVEGYIWCPGLPLFIHHAWVTAGSGLAMDMTIPLDRIREFDYRFYGVAFRVEDVEEQMDRLGHYGILTGPMVVNQEFIFELAPELEDQVRSIGE